MATTLKAKQLKIEREPLKAHFFLIQVDKTRKAHIQRVLPKGLDRKDQNLYNVFCYLIPITYLSGPNLLLLIRQAVESVPMFCITPRR